MKLAEINFLVVEGDAFQRRWIGIMLTNLGARKIMEVADGMTAFKILQDPETAIDISVINLDMPGMDGIELIRHIAKGGRPVSVVLIRASDRSLLFSVETMSRAYGVNLLGTLEMPATPEDLSVFVERFQRHAERIAPMECTPTITADDIRQGVAKREFELLYQPKVELASGQVRGAEAFARWHHPEYGIISPAVFIPMLEQQGEMEAFAWIVIDKAISACMRWHTQGFPLSVSINLSPSCLSHADFSEKLLDLVAARNVDPQTIVIEVTESSAVTNMPYFLENLARLRLKGFGISVDDYGTGHSSLQQLLRIPFSELKIDHSFVAGASSNQALELVLSSSLEICRKLDKQSVAVGVETKQDWDFLRKLGCVYAQGYYIAKPMAADALPMWLYEWAQFF